MKRLLFVFTLSVLTAFTLITCSDSGTGPDPGNGGGNEEETPTYNVSISVTPSDAGSISPAADETYEEGEEVELLANANDGYLFSGWKGDIESSDNPLSLSVDQDYSLTAEFKVKTYDLTVHTDGEGAVDEDILEEKSKEYEHGTVVELTASPAEGYRFKEWTGDITGTENPAQITVDAPKEVTAVFEKKSYSLTIDTEGEGAVEEEIVQEKLKDYEHGAVVRLTAEPDDGWEFSEWKGASNSSDNPINITVDSPKEVTAVFVEKNKSLFYLAENGVTIKCEAAKVGDKGVVNDIEYTKRSADQITPSNAGNTCTSGITNMSYLFWNEASFNGDISHWDVSNVSDMNNMFHYAELFNQDLSSWDVSSVTDMNNMFSGAASFNADINDWDVRSVKDMSSMFAYTGSFNQELNSWDVSSVTDMSSMFYNTEAFNSDISSWDMSGVTNLRNMFAQTDSFNKDLNSWDVSSARNMRGMFNNADSFNGNISDWKVSSVTSMRYMFGGADSFNQDLDLWDVSNVGDMEGMFASAYTFNGNISSWDVSNVSDMSRMFIEAGVFNQDLSSWDVSKVRDVKYMFHDASSFDQDLSGWCVANVNDNFYFSNGSSMSSSDLPVWGTCPE